MQTAIHNLGRRLAFFLLGVCLTAGCSSQPDRLEKFDVQVEQSYLEKYEQQPGVSFLKQGGRYLDDGTKESLALERDHVIPMFERLEQELNLRLVALTSKRDEQTAMAFVAQLPEKVSANDVRKWLEVAQQTFPGAILFESGNRWVSIDFLTPEEEKLLE